MSRKWRIGPLSIVTYTGNAYLLFWRSDKMAFLSLRSPRSLPLFSERYGDRKPTIEFLGWRMFLMRRQKTA